MTGKRRGASKDPPNVSRRGARPGDQGHPWDTKARGGHEPMTYQKKAWAIKPSLTLLWLIVARQTQAPLAFVRHYFQLGRGGFMRVVVKIRDFRGI